MARVPALPSSAATKPIMATRPYSRNESRLRVQLLRNHPELGGLKLATAAPLQRKCNSAATPSAEPLDWMADS